MPTAHSPAYPAPTSPRPKSSAQSWRRAPSARSASSGSSSATAGARHELGADRPVILAALAALPRLAIPLQRAYDFSSERICPRELDSRDGSLLRGVATAIALPPLEAMFNPNGTLYAAEIKRGAAAAEPETRFVLWFNGNGITERYWIPTDTGAGLRDHAVPRAARAFPQRHPRHHRSR